MEKRQCDNYGLETRICIHRGVSTDCNRPEKNLGICGLCPHQMPLNKIEGGMIHRQALREVEDIGTLGID